MRLGPVLVMTPDLDAALDFYGEALGLPLSGREPNQLRFDLGGASLLVFRCERPAPEHRHGADAASVVTFEVESLDASILALKARGVEFIHDQPGQNPAAGFSYAAFRAPGGNVHELVQRLHATAETWPPGAISGTG